MTAVSSILIIILVTNKTIQSNTRAWKYTNIRRKVDSGISILAMRRVIFFELGVEKIFKQIF